MSPPTSSTHGGSFDTISATQTRSDLTTLDYELYGLNPIAAGIAGDPGSYDVFNGALTEFSDAYNVELYSLLNPDAAVNTIPADDLFGSATTIADALGTGTATGAITDFFTVGFGRPVRFLLTSSSSSSSSTTNPRRITPGVRSGRPGGADRDPR